MQVSEIMSRQVFVANLTTTSRDAAKRMRDEHIGAMPVVPVEEPDRPVGMVTDRDIVVKVLGNELEARQTTLGQIMRAPLVTASESEDSSAAIARMRAHGVRRLPITGKHGRLAGIVTLDDLLRRMRLEVDALIDIVANEQDQEKRRER